MALLLGLQGVRCQSFTGGSQLCAESNDLALIEEVMLRLGDIQRGSSSRRITLGLAACLGLVVLEGLRLGLQHGHSRLEALQFTWQ